MPTVNPVIASGQRPTYVGFEQENPRTSACIGEPSEGRGPPKPDPRALRGNEPR